MDINELVRRLKEVRNEFSNQKPGDMYGECALDQLISDVEADIKKIDPEDAKGAFRLTQ